MKQLELRDEKPQNRPDSTQDSQGILDPGQVAAGLGRGHHRESRNIRRRRQQLRPIDGQATMRALGEEGTGFQGKVR